MKTVDEIYLELMDTFARETGMEPNGTGEMAVRMYALAAQVVGLYEQAEWTRRQCFPQTATGEELDKHAFLRGLTRGQASKAEGKIRFSVREEADIDLPIPVGTVCMTAGLVSVETIEYGVLRAGNLSVDVAARAVEAGTGGNVAAGAVRSMAVAPTGIAFCTNPAPFTGGAGEESDESLRERVLETYRRLPNGTNAAFYEREALNIDGVTAVSVLPKNRGLGTVDVFVTGPAGMPQSDLLQKVRDDLGPKREITVDLLVSSPTAVNVNVSAVVKAKAGYTPSEVKARVDSAIRSWFDGTRLAKNVLRAELGQLLYSVDGVENYRLDTPTEDKVIAKDELPVLGTVVVGDLT